MSWTALTLHRCIYHLPFISLGNVLGPFCCVSQTRSPNSESVASSYVYKLAVELSVFVLRSVLRVDRATNCFLVRVRSRGRVDRATNCLMVRVRSCGPSYVLSSSSRSVVWTELRTVFCFAFGRVDRAANCLYGSRSVLHVDRATNCFLPLPAPLDQDSILN
jgi:hypothetical protein